MVSHDSEHAGKLNIVQGARNALQNVLTVEWEGQGKTVLVEVPPASSMRSSEMEMDGLGTGVSQDGRNYGGYGRLDDDVCSPVRIGSDW